MDGAPSRRLLISASAGAQRQQRTATRWVAGFPGNSTPVVEEPVLLQVLVYYEKDADTPDWPKIDGDDHRHGRRARRVLAAVGDLEVQHITWRSA